MPSEDESIAKTSGAAKPVALERRYDVDWLRVLAMALLIIYHIVICFQPWATIIKFPQNDVLLEEVWPGMALINIWRIPILFLISGMGVRFAMERRNWWQLLIDRSLRILLPYIFGILILGVAFYYAMPALGWDAEYTIQFGHLWFLLNIYLYVVWLISILIYLKGAPDNWFFRIVSNLLRRPFGIFLFALPLMLEAWLTSPEYFASYVDSVHGWIMGLICFFAGFVFISVQDDFWPAALRQRWIALGVALLLYLVRLFVFELATMPNWLIALESACWMLAILGFGARYLNRSSRTLGYLGNAVYPVYIVHMPVQFAIAYFVLPLSLPAYLKLAILTVGTFGISLALYEFILKRLKWIRPLFGMKWNIRRPGPTASGPRQVEPSTQ